MKETWTSESHDLHLNSPSCLQLSNTNILIMDTATPNEFYVFQVDTFKVITLTLPEPLEKGSRLSLLDGQVHVIGGSKMVQKIMIENDTVSIQNVSKLLREARRDFVAIGVPLTFFL